MSELETAKGRVAPTVSVRLQAADINRVLTRVPGLTLRYQDGHIQVAKDVSITQVRANVYPSVAGERLRFSVPFAELQGAGGGFLMRTALTFAWNWMETQLEGFLANKLTEMGLPGDMTWVTTGRDSKGGKIANVNVSMAVVNQFLAAKLNLRGQNVRVAGLEFCDDWVDVKAELVSARRAREQSFAPKGY